MSKLPFISFNLSGDIIRMPKTLIFIVFVLSMFSSASFAAQYPDKVVDKLGNGIANAVTGFVEIPKTITIVTHKKAGVQLVSGAGFNSGFITGRHRYNYKEHIPKGLTPKRDRIAQVAKDHGTDIVAAALQFVLASQSFVAIIPGAGRPSQVADNVRAVNAGIPAAFWDQLKGEGLIYAKAEVPE